MFNLRDRKYYKLILVFFFSAVFLGILPYFYLPGKIRLFVVKTGSMIPNIYPGSLVVTQPMKEYHQGEVITYVNPDRNLNEPLSITHRIQLILEKNTQVYFITKGDANSFSDPKSISVSEVIGKVIITIPMLGFFSDFIKSKFGLVFLIGAPGALIIFSEVSAIIRSLKTK